MRGASCCSGWGSLSAGQAWCPQGLWAVRDWLCGDSRGQKPQGTVLQQLPHPSTWASRWPPTWGPRGFHPAGGLRPLCCLLGVALCPALCDPPIPVVPRVVVSFSVLGPAVCSLGPQLAGILGRHSSALLHLHQEQHCTLIPQSQVQTAPQTSLSPQPCLHPRTLVLAA